MDEKTLTRLLRIDGTDAGRPGGRCPDESILAAYADRRLPEPTRAEFEAHLADCDACQGQIAFLASLPESVATPVPPGAVARARALADRRRSPWRPLVLRWGTALAFSAGVVLAVVAVLRQGPAFVTPGTASHGPERSPAGAAAPPAAPASPLAESAERPPSSVTKPEAQSPEPRANTRPPEAGRRLPEAGVRTSAPAAPGPSLIFPADAATIAPKDLEFRWQAVPAARYYEVSIVSDEGTLVWHGRLEGTSTRPPEGTRLGAGAKYFVWVKAFLAGGESVKSATVSFRVAGQ